MRVAAIRSFAGSFAAALMLSATTHAEQPQRFEIRGDAVPMPLSERTGDVAKGRRIVLDREVGNCLICHRVPEPTERFMGDLGPPLDGVGSRLTEGQLRFRLIDQAMLNPATIMPPYHRIEGLMRVAERYRGRPVLTAQEIEDVVAYLASLKE
jgi:sulfur-oxidizing protein SoxX